ncbi:MAG: hypothetical protein KAJ40_04290 [Alphaproteobacteria bacterium]|nr:hypothetical protein [Alphaproteobacteria bacterium]
MADPTKTTVEPPPQKVVEPSSMFGDFKRWILVKGIKGLAALDGAAKSLNESGTRLSKDVEELTESAKNVGDKLPADKSPAGPPPSSELKQPDSNLSPQEPQNIADIKIVQGIINGVIGKINDPIAGWPIRKGLESAGLKIEGELDPMPRTDGHWDEKSLGVLNDLLGTIKKGLKVEGLPDDYSPELRKAIDNAFTDLENKAKDTTNPTVAMKAGMSKLAFDGIIPPEQRKNLFDALDRLHGNNGLQVATTVLPENKNPEPALVKKEEKVEPQKEDIKSQKIMALGTVGETLFELSGKIENMDLMKSIGKFGGLFGNITGDVIKPLTKENLYTTGPNGELILSSDAQDFAHKVIMGLKMIGGDENATGEYNAAIGEKLKAAISAKPEYKKIREEWKEDDRNAFFRSLNVLEQTGGYDNQKAKSVNKNNMMLDVAATMLSEHAPGLQAWIKDFFTNSDLGQMIAGFLGDILGIDIKRLWGDKSGTNEDHLKEQIDKAFDSTYEKANVALKEDLGRDPTVSEVMSKVQIDTHNKMFKGVSGFVIGQAMKPFFKGADEGFVQKTIEEAMKAAVKGTTPEEAKQLFMQNVENAFVDYKNKGTVPPTLEEMKKNIENIPAAAKELGYDFSHPLALINPLTMEQVAEGMFSRARTVLGGDASPSKVAAEVSKTMSHLFELSNDGSSSLDKLSLCKRLTVLLNGDDDKENINIKPEDMDSVLGNLSLIYGGMDKAAKHTEAFAKGNATTIKYDDLPKEFMKNYNKNFKVTAASIGVDPISLRTIDSAQSKQPTPEKIAEEVTNAQTVIVGSVFNLMFNAAQEELGDNASVEAVIKKIEQEITEPTPNALGKTSQIVKYFHNNEEAKKEMLGFLEVAGKGETPEAAKQILVQEFRKNFLAKLQGVTPAFSAASNPIPLLHPGAIPPLKTFDPTVHPITTVPPVDAKMVNVGDNQYISLVYKENTENFSQEPVRYAHGRVGVIQDVLAKNAGKLGLSMNPNGMKNEAGKFSDTATPYTCAVIEETVIRAQLHDLTKTGKEITQASLNGLDRKLTAGNLGIVTAYMEAKGVSGADISRFTENVTELSKDHYSTDSKYQEVGERQETSVLEQSVIGGQFDLNISQLSPAQIVIPVATPGKIDPLRDKYLEYNKGNTCEEPLFYMKEGSDSVFAIYREKNGTTDPQDDEFKELEFDRYRTNNAIQSSDEGDMNALFNNYVWACPTEEGLRCHINCVLGLSPKNVSVNLPQQQSTLPLNQKAVETASVRATDFNNRAMDCRDRFPVTNFMRGIPFFGGIASALAWQVEGTKAKIEERGFLKPNSISAEELYGKNCSEEQIRRFVTGSFNDTAAKKGANSAFKENANDCCGPDNGKNQPDVSGHEASRQNYSNVDPVTGLNN